MLVAPFWASRDMEKKFLWVWGTWRVTCDLVLLASRVSLGWLSRGSQQHFLSPYLYCQLTTICFVGYMKSLECYYRARQIAS